MDKEPLNSYAAIGTSTAFSLNPDDAGVFVAPLFLTDLDDNDVQIRPDGITYIAIATARQKLNGAFGSGGWFLEIVRERVVDSDKNVGPELILDVRLWGVGRPVVETFGSARLKGRTYGNALSTARSQGVTRCALELGIGAQLKDKIYVEEWKRRAAVLVDVVGNGRDNKGETNKFWRRRDDPPFRFPWSESDAGTNQPRAAKSAPKKTPPVDRQAIAAAPPATAKKTEFDGRGSVVETVTLDADAFRYLIQNVGVSVYGASWPSVRDSHADGAFSSWGADKLVELALTLIESANDRRIAASTDGYLRQLIATVETIQKARGAKSKK